ncbi:hypothetical protein AKJ35_00640 [candidate division MSBL1 archaeon SCGC-AAA833F18]|uniref:CRISPR system ring nuclease SSO1393-like domain-containing protein n=2 Tax=candidate division MSBL1 TaxID=215777 RepID=A0A133VSV1_9EURY|nr:hypothetical protein AKJ48_00995 [candidate division MSBL1 archaeon SCGC-AAA261O19]KXB09524.1 hypothetical protein AKJ35_00640 [candidate division MSBL1 archaeon SCGC-AAA833F18]
MAKIAIQGIGEHPAPVIFVIEKEEPDVSYVLTSDYSYDHVDGEGGFDKSSGEAIADAAEKIGTEVKFMKCDTFDPEEIGEKIGEILGGLDPDDEVIINYTAGSATIKIILGATAVAISRFMENLRIVYAIKYPDGTEKYLDQTEALGKLFTQLNQAV